MPHLTIYTFNDTEFFYLLFTDRSPDIRPEGKSRYSVTEGDCKGEGKENCIMRASRIDIG